MRTPLAAARATLALLIAGLALAGCMKVDAALVVNSDDTVSGDVVLAVDRRLANVTGQSEDRLVATLGLDKEKLPATATIERYEDAGFVGVRVSYAKTPLAQFNGVSGRDAFTLVRSGNEYAFSGSVDLRTVNLLDPGIRAFADQFSFRIAVTFPGKVTEHNGVLSGKTVSWQPKAGEIRTLQARAKVDGPVPWVPLVAAGVGLAAVGTVLVVFLLSRRNRPRRIEEPTLVEYPHDML
ncbi:hypothetical protein HDA40_006194 [Hamadaea flava]|uniref:DUF3153 domain-containing protein n=1 Tax=Hamadaea flava TaxID=1742688 RepID=A0ABV8LTW3_9ACTN|nr:DUF3153 domain-containing protein [Hamadaea flava]MCP2327687.1 hypothetical protein [Hamadaea flava]